MKLFKGFGDRDCGRCNRCNHQNSCVDFAFFLFFFSLSVARLSGKGASRVRVLNRGTGYGVRGNKDSSSNTTHLKLTPFFIASYYDAFLHHCGLDEDEKIIITNANPRNTLKKRLETNFANIILFSSYSIRGQARQSSTSLTCLPTTDALQFLLATTKQS